MARFLSPAKICLVLLIDLYADRQAQPADTIHLLSLISRHVVRPSTTSPAAQKQIIKALDLLSIEAILSPLTSNFPGRSLYDVFLQYLWSLTGLEQFDELFDKSKAEPSSKRQVITDTSPIGQYLRRCHLEFFRMPFSESQQLWEDFTLFREPTWREWAYRNPLDAARFIESEKLNQGIMSEVMLDRQIKRRDNGPKGIASEDMVSATIQTQLDFLQGTGCRLPTEMQQQLAAMIEYTAVAPADVYFIKFFDAWRSGCYIEANDCLHRYFDHAIEGHESSQNIKTYHQYALLHLAVLHADFGRMEDAIAAMDECIATARENQDPRCLHFGLSWLIHLRKTHPEFVSCERIAKGAQVAGNESDILLYLQQEAVKNKDWTQLSSTMVSLAETVIRDTANLPRALEFSYQALHVNQKNSLHRLQPTQIRLHGALFGLLGCQTVADAALDIFRVVYAEQATQPELHGLKSMQAYHQVAKGRYDQALRDLQEVSASKNRTLRMQNLHYGLANMCRFKHALHRNEMFIAGRLLRQIQALRTMVEPDIAFETQVLEIEYLRKTGRVAEAFDKIAQVFEHLNENPDKAYVQRMRLLVIKANMWAHVGKPAKGFSIALRAANAAYTHMLQPLLWSAVGALAGILESMQEFDASQQLLESVLPRAIEGPDVLLTAQLYSRLTDAYVGMACKNHAHGSKERASLLSMAHGYLEQAREGFDHMQDVDGILSCLEKKAMLFRYRGDESLAEEMDRMHETVSEEACKRDNEARGLNVEAR